MSGHQFTLLLHLLGAGVLVGVIFFSLTLSIEKSLTSERLRMIRYIRPFGRYAAIWQLATGLLLASQDWEDFSRSQIFWAKIILFVADGIVAERIINRKLQLLEGQAKGEKVPTNDLALWGWVSALIILTIFIFGYLIHIHHDH